MVRGWLARARYKKRLFETQETSQYFKRQELLETVQKGQNYDPLSKPRKHVEYQYSTGALYRGEMRGGFRDGRGLMVWPDKASYDGEWKEGYACGQGVFFHADGDVYDGGWLNNKCKGYGTYTNKNGACYKGYWKNDTQCGTGTETWPEGSKYNGMYVDG